MSSSLKNRANLVPFYHQVDDIAEAESRVPVYEMILFFQQQYKTVVGVCG